MDRFVITEHEKARHVATWRGTGRIDGQGHCQGHFLILMDNMSYSKQRMNSFFFLFFFFTTICGEYPVGVTRVADNSLCKIPLQEEINMVQVGVCMCVISFFFLFSSFRRTSAQLSLHHPTICLPRCLVVMERHDKGTWANPFPPCHLQAFRSAAALFRLD